MLVSVIKSNGGNEMTEYTPPKLKHHEGSWMIVDVKTGDNVLELFRDSKVIGKLNTDKYKAVPISEYLSSLNKKG